MEPKDTSVFPNKTTGTTQLPPLLLGHIFFRTRVALSPRALGTPPPLAPRACPALGLPRRVCGFGSPLFDLEQSRRKAEDISVGAEALLGCISPTHARALSTCLFFRVYSRACSSSSTISGVCTVVHEWVHECFWGVVPPFALWSGGTLVETASSGVQIWWSVQCSRHPSCHGAKALPMPQVPKMLCVGLHASPPHGTH